MANTQSDAAKAIAIATRKAVSIGKSFVTAAENCNGTKKALAWKTVGKLVPVVSDLSNNAFTRVRKEYEETGVARKTAQVHFGMARAIAKGNYTLPTWENTNAGRNALPSMRDVFQNGFSASGEVKTPKAANLSPKQGGVNGPANGGDLPSKGTPAAYTVDAPEVKAALAALVKVGRMDTPPSRADWQKVRRNISTISAAIKIVDH